MTGEEAIRRAMEVIAWHDEKSRKRREDFDDHTCGTLELPDHLDTHGMMASAIRALLPLARTGLLVERTLASHREIVLWKFEPGNAPPSVVIGTDTDQCGSCDIELAHAPTLAAAVEAALKGTP